MKTVSIVREFVCACALLAACDSGLAAAQTLRADPLEPAIKALNEGKYDDVASLVRSSTDRRAVALRAQADVARGRYAEAQKLLTPAAQVSPGGDAALDLGLLHLYLGRRAEGRRMLQAVMDRASNSQAAADLLHGGLAARALGQFEDANIFFSTAAALAPTDVLVNTAWGELFLEKYNKQDALKSFQAALAADPAWVPAQLGFARTVADENPPVARDLAEKALRTNPDSVPVLLFIAELELDDAKRTEARAMIKRALQANPNSLEARSLDAGVAFIEGRVAEFDVATADILKINPSYGEVYRIAGEQAAKNYRFEEAETMTRRAVGLDGTSSRAWADLGMYLLRIGDEPGARRALDTSFKTDPYDIITFNLLALLDTLDQFVTVTDGDIVMRFHKGDVGVMQEYAVPLARQAIDALSARWDFKPKGPILIEMFPKHDDFAVRTLGLPGMIGALGACFGRVVTLDSPKARPPGEFNWGATLWHELAHVITLQMSNQRIPRWLSEGISVFEEKRARREWGREMEMEFAHTLEKGGVLTLRNLNAGFSDPKTISLSYYEASLLVEHIVERFGEAKLHDLVKSFTSGIDTETALTQAVGVTIDDLQATFTGFLDRNFGSLRRALKQPDLPAQGGTVDELKALAAKDPDSYPLQMLLGQTLRKAGDSAGAIAALERAAVLVPTATGAASPNVMIAAIAIERNDKPRAIAALEALAKVDHIDIKSARKLASLVAPLGDAGRAAAAYERVVGIDPFDVDAEANLGRFALLRRDAPTAIRAFKAVLATGPVDRATAHTNLADAYLLAGQRADAKKQTLAALEIAPQFERAQEILLKLIE